MRSIKNMNAQELCAFLKSLSRSALESAIIDNAIMRCYMCLTDFYPEHAVAALRHFQKKSVLILSISELNKIMKEEHYVF